METQDVDVVVVGGGIAGATVAAHLAPDHRVALIEAEEQAGYHTTGRSAALWILNYGPEDVRLLTGLSRPFFVQPPPGFADASLKRDRPMLMLARADQAADMAEHLRTARDAREIGVAEAHALLPALRPGHIAQAATEDAFDMDVAALHQGFLRQLRRAGGAIALRHRSSRIEHRGGAWHVETSGTTTFQAPIVVDAAGAWGDEVAEQAGIRPLGLVPKRRTGVIIDPVSAAGTRWDVADWPSTYDIAGEWYCRPEARTRLMVSPADETPMHAHDVQPDELDVALAIDRMQQALDIEVRRTERQWAGLRTFTPDGSLAFGWAADAPGFFWCVGQGGYGIQTSPAAGKLVADLIAGRDPGPAAACLPAVDPRRFAAPK